MTESFRGRYLRTLTLLNMKPSPRDGFSAGQLAKVERRLGIRLPKALRDYYLLVGKHKINQTHNRLLAPDRILVGREHIIFMEENQNVVCWGVSCRRSAADPPVLQAIDSVEGPWGREASRCSVFLAVMLCLQASSDPFGPSGFADRVSLESLRKVAKRWSFIGRFHELSAYAADGQAICVTTEKKTAVVQVGAASEQALLDFKNRFGIDIHMV